MPSIPHELSGDMFGRRPSLVFEFLKDHLGDRVPKDAQLEISDPTTISTDLPDWHADRLVLFRHLGRVIYATIVETQLAPDRVKRRRWPQYQTIVHGRHDCPTGVLVVCADDATARWSGNPIALDYNGSLIRPIAVGPKDMPLITNLDDARELPLLAALSLIGHPEDESVRAAAVAAALQLFEEAPIKARVYHDFMLKRLKGRERRLWEDLVLTTGGYRYESKVFRELEAKGRNEGRAEGHAEAILRVLERHGIDVTDADRERILTCRDLATLDLWLDRALDAKDVEDLFI